MNPRDRFIVCRYPYEPVYTSNTITGVIAYLWGRKWRGHFVMVYEVPIELTSGNLAILRRKLYTAILNLTPPHGTETPVF